MPVSEVADFHEGAVGDVEPGFVEAFVADAAHVSGAVALSHDHVEFLFQSGAEFFREFLACDKGHFHVQVFAQVEALFFGLLRQVHEVGGLSHVAGGAEFLHDVDLSAGVARSGGDHGAAEVAQGFFEHQAGGRQVVVEGDLCHVA